MTVRERTRLKQPPRIRNGMRIVDIVISSRSNNLCNERIISSTDHPTTILDIFHTHLCSSSCWMGMEKPSEAEKLELLEKNAEAEKAELLGKNGHSAKRRWKKVRYELVDYHSLPEFLRDNEYILRHYRCQWPLKQVFLSVFSIHNETLNIWTHLVGFFLFLCLTIYTAAKLPKVVNLGTLSQLRHIPMREDLHRLQTELMTTFPALSNSLDYQKLQAELKTSLPSMVPISSLSHWHLPQSLANCLPESLLQSTQTQQCSLQTVKHDILSFIAPYMQTPTARWPFFVFLGGAMFCLLASSTCHLLSCHSELLSYIMLRLDYTGIAGLIASSFYPPVYYSFICHEFLRNFYLTIITLMGVAAIIASLLPIFQQPKFRTFRASLFFGMGVSGIAPILHKLILYRDDPMAYYTTAYEVAMGTCYGLGALVYASRVPEKWKPGKFDIAGHSHQLFHILVVAGALIHYKAGLLYLEWRDMKGCSAV